MKNIKQIEQTLFEIAQTLADNTAIQKYLFVDSNNLQDASFLTYQHQDAQVMLDNNYISLIPDLENGIIKSDRNTFIVLQLNSLIFTSDIEAHGSIHICTDKHHVLLTPNQSRLLVLVNEVLRALDMHKFAAATTVDITSATYTIYSEFTFGYTLNFTIKDKSIRKAEI